MKLLDLLHISVSGTTVLLSFLYVYQVTIFCLGHFLVRVINVFTIMPQENVTEVMVTDPKH